METAVRVTAERSLADCQFGHLFQAVQMLMHGLGHHMAVLAKEQFKIIIEILVEATQRDIFHAFLILDESGKVLVRSQVRIKRFLDAVQSDPLAEILVMFPEQGQQGKRFLADTHDSVLYQFCCNEAEIMFDCVVMSGNLFRQFIYGTVHRHGIRTASVGTAFFRIPDVGIDGYLRANLFPFGINAHLAQ